MELRTSTQSKFVRKLLLRDLSDFNQLLGIASRIRFKEIKVDGKCLDSNRHVNDYTIIQKAKDTHNQDVYIIGKMLFVTYMLSLMEFSKGTSIIYSHAILCNKALALLGIF